MDLIAYIRVSSVGQIDGFGADVQRNNVATWAAANGHRIIAEVFDPGVSGTVEALDREGFSRLAMALQEGAADGVVISSLCRLARTLHVQEAALSVLWKANATVFSADQGEIVADDPDDPMRKLIRQILGAVAEYERAAITLRMRKGAKEKRDQGGYAGGQPPFGWMAVRGTLERDETEQQTILRMVGLRAQGFSFMAIAQTLNEMGIKTRSGSMWAGTQVNRVLTRENIV
jgi:DNA invertase Pin-like site-specific DNA recombinase